MGSRTDIMLLCKKRTDLVLVSWNRRTVLWTVQMLPSEGRVTSHSFDWRPIWRASSKSVPVVWVVLCCCISTWNERVFCMLQNVCCFKWKPVCSSVFSVFPRLRVSCVSSFSEASPRCRSFAGSGSCITSSGWPSRFCSPQPDPLSKKNRKSEKESRRHTVGLFWRLDLKRKAMDFACWSDRGFVPQSMTRVKRGGEDVSSSFPPNFSYPPPPLPVLLLPLLTFTGIRDQGSPNWCR